MLGGSDWCHNTVTVVSPLQSDSPIRLAVKLAAMNRRQFIQKSTLAAAAIAIPSNMPAQKLKIDIYGRQD